MFFCHHFILSKFYQCQNMNQNSSSMLFGITFMHILTYFLMFVLNVKPQCFFFDLSKVSDFISTPIKDHFYQIIILNFLCLKFSLSAIVYSPDIIYISFFAVYNVVFSLNVNPFKSVILIVCIIFFINFISLIQYLCYNILTFQ